MKFPTGLKLAISALAALLCALPALADSYTGKVLDETGSPMAEAVIKVEGADLFFMTDTEGHFSFTVDNALKAYRDAAGGIRITVSFVGYTSETRRIYPGASAVEDNVIQLTPERMYLNEVVVTATRTPKALKDVPVITRLISTEELRKVDATNIQDLLTEEIPGLEFGYAMNQEVSLNMNGFGGSSVLFLVDGERLAGETMDNVDYNRLNLGNVGKIEIVKGASSALYGANAVGGVVNLITRESLEPWTVNLDTRYRAAGNEWRAGGSVSFNTGRWNSSTSVQYTTVDNIQLTDPFDTESNIHQIYGGSTLNIKERLIYKVNDKLRFIARGGYFYRISTRNTYDDHYRDYTGGLRGEWNIDASQTLELSYSYDRYDKSRYVGGVLTDQHDYSNRQHIVRGLYSKMWQNHCLTAGADYMHDFLTSYQFTDNAAHVQTSVDAFVQFDYNPLSWLNLVASLRDDYFSASDENAVTARLAAMFKLRPLTLRASYAGGFRAPTLKEMYMNFDMAGIMMVYGNPDLLPEKSHNFNMSIERNGNVRGGFFSGYYSMTVSGNFNYYERRITTMDVDSDADREAGILYCNEDGAKATGLDVSLRYKLDAGLGLFLSYNFFHTIGRTVDAQFTQPRPHSATWRLDYDYQFSRNYSIYAALSGRYLSSPDTEVPTSEAYSIWKFTLQQRVWQGISINLVIDNLFNYRPEVYYWNSAPTTGITWSLGLTLDIDRLIRS